MFKFFIALVLLTPSLLSGQEGISSQNYIRRAVALEKTAPDLAYLYADSALILSGDDHSMQARVYHTLGNIFYAQGAFSQAMDYYLKSETHFNELHNEEGVALNRLQLGKVYYYVKQPRVSLEHFKEALESYHAFKDIKHVAEVNGEIGHLFEKSGDYDTALAYARQALQLYEQINDKAGMAHIFENLGSIYEDLEEFDRAHQYFQKAAILNQKLGNKVELVSNLNNIGDSYRKTGRLDSALAFTHKSLGMARNMELKYQQSSALRDLGKIYYLMDERDSAYYYQEQSRDIYEEVYSQESSRQMALLQTLYEVERKNGEIQLLENEQHIQRVTRYGLAATALSVILLGGVVVSRQRLKIRNNQELLAQKEKLHRSAMENTKLAEERLKIELEHKQLQEKHLNLELETQQKSLAARMLQLIEKNKLLEQLRDGLNDIKGQVPGEEARTKLKQLTNQINYSFNHDKAWDDFRQSFEQIHQEFFERLKKENADLTSNDLRICALMRINLRSKDIALLLGISQDSLRVARYRLRKKLRIDTGDNLRKYLLNI